MINLYVIHDLVEHTQEFVVGLSETQRKVAYHDPNSIRVSKFEGTVLIPMTIQELVEATE